MRLLKAPNGQKDYDVQSDRQYWWHIRPFPSTTAGKLYVPVVRGWILPSVTDVSLNRVQVGAQRKSG